MATATQSLQNFIDGRFVDASGSESDSVLNPSTAQEIATAPRAAWRASRPASTSRATRR